MQEARHNNLSLFRRLKQLLKDDSRVFIFFANEHHSETFPDEIKGESPNDRNDRAIRIATSWLVMTASTIYSFCVPLSGIDLFYSRMAFYDAQPALPYPGRFSQQLDDSEAVMLLTNDRANLALAQKDNLRAMTIHSYVESVREQYPDLTELLAPEESSAMDVEDQSSKTTNQTMKRREGQRVLLFEEHKPMSELTAGIRQGR